MTVDELDTCLLDRLEADRQLAGDHYPRGGSRLLLLLAMGTPQPPQASGPVVTDDARIAYAAAHAAKAYAERHYGLPYARLDAEARAACLAHAHLDLDEAS